MVCPQSQAFTILRYITRSTGCVAYMWDVLTFDNSLLLRWLMQDFNKFLARGDQFDRYKWLLMPVKLGAKPE